jgi:hypothetical protein
MFLYRSFNVVSIFDYMIWNKGKTGYGKPDWKLGLWETGLWVVSSPRLLLLSPTGFANVHFRLLSIRLRLPSCQCFTVHFRLFHFCLKLFAYVASLRYLESIFAYWKIAYQLLRLSVAFLRITEILS